MGYEGRDLATLVAEIKAASANLERGDARVDARIDELARNIDEIYRKFQRPSPGGGFDGADERKSDIEMCKMHHAERVPKIDGVTKEYSPSGF
jgi:hypothetical protein